MLCTDADRQYGLNQKPYSWRIHCGRTLSFPFAHSRGLGYRRGDPPETARHAPARPSILLSCRHRLSGRRGAAAHFRSVSGRGAALSRLRPLPADRPGATDRGQAGRCRRYRRGFAQGPRPVALAAHAHGGTCPAPVRGRRGDGCLRHAVLGGGPDFARGGGEAAAAGAGGAGLGVDRSDCRQ